VTTLNFAIRIPQFHKIIWNLPGNVDNLLASMQQAKDGAETPQRGVSQDDDK
jgi:hypothetical protein